MTDKEAIEARVSRRNYRGRLGEGDIHRLQTEIVHANVDGHLEMQFVEDGAAVFAGLKNSYGIFSGVHSLIVLAGRDDTPHLKERCGYYGQRLVLEAVKMGLGTCWVGGTYDRASVQGSLPTRHELVAVVTVGPVKEEKGMLERTISRALVKKRKDPKSMAQTEGEAPDWFMAGLYAAQRAPSAMNRQPVRFSFKDGVAAARVASEEGFNLVDLGIAKLQFEIGAGGRFALGNGGVLQKSE